VEEVEVLLPVERRNKVFNKINIRAISLISKNWLLAKARAEIEVCVRRGQMHKCSDLWVGKIK